MKKIGILGGTFNPPHIGHLIVANEVRHALDLEEVRLMPTAIPPHKLTAGHATASQRLAMTRLAVEEIEGLSVSAFEVERGGVSYTYDTMRRLKDQEPNHDFYFIIGGDMIDMLSDWYKIDELMNIVKFVGVERPETIGKTTFPITMIDIPQIELSSTVIRQRLSTRGTVELILPTKVERFIREEGLYGSNSLTN